MLGQSFCSEADEARRWIPGSLDAARHGVEINPYMQYMLPRYGGWLGEELEGAAVFAESKSGTLEPLWQAMYLTRPPVRELTCYIQIDRGREGPGHFELEGRTWYSQDLVSESGFTFALFLQSLEGVAAGSMVNFVAIKGAEQWEIFRED